MTKEAAEFSIWTANRVVRAVCIYLFLAWSTKAIYDGNVYTGYLFNLVSHQNSRVGMASGVSGLSMVILAPVLGVISDRYGRIVLLKIGMLVGYCAVALLVRAITIDSFDAILIAQVVFGAFWACTTPTMDALIADWSNPGTRSMIYTLRLTIVQSASTCGPLLNIVLFFAMGNQWNMKICRSVMYVGLGLFLIPTTLLHFSFPMSFDDTSKQKEEDSQQTYEQLPSQSSHGKDATATADDVEMTQTSKNAQTSSGQEDESYDDEAAFNPFEQHKHFEQGRGQPQVQDVSATLTKSKIPDDDDDDKDASATLSLYCSLPCLHEVLYIPAMISIYEMTTMLASGMSVNFFPIYFLHVLRLDPIQVQLVYLLTPILTATFANIAQKLSRVRGRIFMTCSVIFCGTSLLVLMAFITGRNVHVYASSAESASGALGLAIEESNDDIGVWRWVLVLVFLLRSAFMNCTKPLTKSILMDFVPKAQRGRWNALQSVNVFSWSGSAFIGGMVIDRYGFTGIFLTTALCQSLAMLPLLAVSKHVPLEK